MKLQSVQMLDWYLPNLLSLIPRGSSLSLCWVLASLGWVQGLSGTTGSNITLTHRRKLKAAALTCRLVVAFLRTPLPEASCSILAEYSALACAMRCAQYPGMTSSGPSLTSVRASVSACHILAKPNPAPVWFAPSSTTGSSCSILSISLSTS